MKHIGDKYVRHEFQAHKNTSDSAQITKFTRSWTDYLFMLQKRRRGDDKFGRNMDRSDVANKLNDEQKEKLAQLQEEVRKL
mgnify:CR=1 FL=1